MQRARIAATGLTLVGIVAWAAGCRSDRVAGIDSTRTDTTLASAPFIVSNAMARAVSAGARAHAPQFALSGPTIAWISLPAGSIPAGMAATIRNRHTADTLQLPVLDGGFDPIPVSAAPGDTLIVVIHLDGGAMPLGFAVVVPASRRPIVVRTNPPPKRRDVPWNTSIVIVFSEPIDSATVTTSNLQLRRASSLVSGVLRFADSAHTAVEFGPAGPLAASTDYEVLITQGVRDLDGDALDGAVTVPFTTAAQVAPPPSVPRGPFLVSNPVRMSWMDTVFRAYVALPTGTLPAGRSVEVHNVRHGVLIGGGWATFLDGGFDPVRVPAAVGDTLTITVLLSSGDSLHFAATVPATSAPSVVRTNPGAGQLGVPSDANLVIVFSEPINDASIFDTTFTPTSILLTRSGAPVSGRVGGGGYQVVSSFVPNARLLTGTVYQLQVTGAVTSLGGAPLEAPVTVSFTTEQPPSGPSDAVLTVVAFTMIEFQYPGDTSGFWYYAPQLRVAESTGKSAARVTVMSFTVPGLLSPLPLQCAPRTLVAAGQSMDLFSEVYGDYELSYFNGNGARGTGGNATAVITYRDDAGRTDSLIVQGPVVAGAPPTTYSGGNGHGYFTPLLGGCQR